LKKPGLDAGLFRARRLGSADRGRVHEDRADDGGGTGDADALFGFGASRHEQRRAPNAMTFPALRGSDRGPIVQETTR
jgi:hypothetical protein